MPRTRISLAFLGGRSKRWPGSSRHIRWLVMFIAILGGIQTLTCVSLASLWVYTSDIAECLATREGTEIIEKSYPVIYANIKKPEMVIPVQAFINFDIFYYKVIAIPIVLGTLLMGLVHCHYSVGIRNSHAILFATLIVAGYGILAWQLAMLRDSNHATTEAYKWCWATERKMWYLEWKPASSKQLRTYCTWMSGVIGLLLIAYIGLAFIAVSLNRTNSRLEAQDMHMEERSRQSNNVENQHESDEAPLMGSQEIGILRSASSVSTDTRSGITFPEAAVQAND
ncbi:predicted protein [Plenodomus lingam JN3]|uniref:Predicted protein n=1 Tax=Leptosphaeria maculans (strain JN3 / isolate v23.1.3 / race Av1-4-5-6-7-8) TaxID=985895 RepID=E4ZHU8_LEPMJ|nr:predicted protein [Plenodomus lingam JN3]CBX90931.1 predicted protein [Plenodomus lingam JN3]